MKFSACSICSVNSKKLCDQCERGEMFSVRHGIAGEVANIENQDEDDLVIDMYVEKDF